MLTRGLRQIRSSLSNPFGISSFPRQPLAPPLPFFPSSSWIHLSKKSTRTVQMRRRCLLSTRRTSTLCRFGEEQAGSTRPRSTLTGVWNLGVFLFFSSSLGSSSISSPRPFWANRRREAVRLSWEKVLRRNLPISTFSDTDSPLIFSHLLQTPSAYHHSRWNWFESLRSDRIRSRWRRSGFTRLGNAVLDLCDDGRFLLS